MAAELVQAAPLGQFTERIGTLAVEVDEGADRLAAALGRGRPRRRPWTAALVLVQLDDERPWDIVRDAVADLDLPLVRIQQRRRGLEELFR